MGTKNNPGTYDCYEAAEADEPMFVLLARDPLAPLLVTAWAQARHQLGVVRYGSNAIPWEELDRIQEAINCAATMRTWRIKNRED